MEVGFNHFGGLSVTVQVGFYLFIPSKYRLVLGKGVGSDASSFCGCRGKKPDLVH